MLLMIGLVRKIVKSYDVYYFESFPEVFPLNILIVSMFIKLGEKKYFSESCPLGILILHVLDYLSNVARCGRISRRINSLTLSNGNVTDLVGESIIRYQLETLPL